MAVQPRGGERPSDFDLFGSRECVPTSLPLLQRIRDRADAVIKRAQGETELNPRNADGNPGRYRDRWRIEASFRLKDFRCISSRQRETHDAAREGALPGVDAASIAYSSISFVVSTSCFQPSSGERSPRMIEPMISRWARQMRTQEPPG